MSNLLVVSPRQLAKLEQSLSLVRLVQEEIGRTELYAVGKVAETLHVMAAEVKTAERSGRLTAEKLAAVDRLTDRYLASVSQIADQASAALSSRLPR